MAGTHGRERSGGKKGIRRIEGAGSSVTIACPHGTSSTPGILTNS